MGRSHDQTGSDPSRDLTCDKSCDQAPKPASNQSCDKEREHDLMHAYFCRRNLCYSMTDTRAQQTTKLSEIGSALTPTRVNATQS